MSDKAEQKHTPLPWGVASTSVSQMYDIKVRDGHSLACTHDNRYIPSNAKHDAEFIVLAANNHYKLVEALEEILDSGFLCGSTELHDRLRDKARQALAEVKS